MGTRLLILIRHAKAEAGGANDVLRPLALRGRGDAAAIGAWLAASEITPDRVVVSPAVRAQQTWALAAVLLTTPVEPVLDDGLYVNTVEALLALIQATPPEVGTLVLVGHNPSVAELAMELADVTEEFKTGAVAVLDVDVPWAELDAGLAKLADFSVPRHGRGPAPPC